MTRLVRILTIASVLLVPLAADADQAGPHIEKATLAHKEGRFADALVELQAAYAIDPRPELLYAIGQVQVKLGRCGDAISSYELYLATNPSERSAGATHQAIETCRAQLAAAPPPPPAGPPPSAAPPSSRARPWYTDKVGDALVLGGAVAGVFGVVIYVGARSDLDSAEAAPTLTRYDELVDRARTKRAASVVLIGGGVALIGAGIVHYLVHDRATESRGVGVVPATGGGLVTWTGRF